MQNVLVLGAGMVANPLVQYLLEKGFAVKVASQVVSEKVQAMVKAYPNTASVVSFDVRDDALLDKLVSECDLAVSLLPYIYHVNVAKCCIKYKKNMVTTSYVSPAMRALDDDAKNAGIILLNEIGLDPGIDHMSAIKMIHHVGKQGGKVVSFRSYCGGLPAMQSNNRPLGYKFSWSPRGVVLAGRNNGQYLKDGDVVFIPGRDLFKYYDFLDIEGVGVFEGYTNRDALPYKEIYGLKDAQTVFRGTLRNVGWCYTMKKVAELGLLDDSPREDLKGLTYQEMMLRLIGLDESFDLVQDVADFLNIEVHSTVIKNLEWLGLFSDEPLPNENNVMDMYAALLLKKLSMDADDLDLVVMYHEFIAEYGEKKEKLTSSLVCTGIPGGDSAMAQTVALPAAIGAKMILDGKIQLKGVHIPVKPEIYEPILAELETKGVTFIERCKSL